MEGPGSIVCLLGGTAAIFRGDSQGWRLDGCCFLLPFLSHGMRFGCLICGVQGGEGPSSSCPALQHWGWGSIGCHGSIHSPFLSWSRVREPQETGASPSTTLSTTGLLCCSPGPGILRLAAPTEVTCQNSGQFGFTWTLKE